MATIMDTETPKPLMLAVSTSVNGTPCTVMIRVLNVIQPPAHDSPLIDDYNTVSRVDYDRLRAAIRENALWLPRDHDFVLLCQIRRIEQTEGQTDSPMLPPPLALTAGSIDWVLEQAARTFLPEEIPIPIDLILLSPTPASMPQSYPESPVHTPSGLHSPTWPSSRRPSSGTSEQDSQKSPPKRPRYGEYPCF